MQYLCQNGIDYDGCTELVENEGDICSTCEENAYDSYLEGFYGGSSVMSLDEQMKQARKLK